MHLGHTWSLARIRSLVESQERESSELEYKASPALALDNDKNKTELSKDVSALANGSGGVVIYGVTANAKDKSLPEAMDGGVPSDALNVDRINQILNSRIHPRILGIRVHEIAAEDARGVYYVIEVPQSATGSPHQAHDRIYYQRVGIEVLKMEDFQIRDVMRRGQSADLRLSYQPIDTNVRYFLTGPNTQNGWTNAYSFPLNVVNLNDEPASQVLLNVYVDHRLLIVDEPENNRGSGVASVQIDGIQRHSHFRRYVRNNPDVLPIFKGVPWILNAPGWVFQFPDSLVDDEESFFFAWDLRAPRMIVRSGVISLNVSARYVTITEETDMGSQIRDD